MAEPTDEQLHYLAQEGHILGFGYRDGKLEGAIDADAMPIPADEILERFSDELSNIPDMTDRMPK